MMSMSQIEANLVSEIGLSHIQARVYLLVTCHGKMSSAEISRRLGIQPDDARKAAEDLMALGAFIDISDTEFEAMHPRFTAVNMFRKMCQRTGTTFQRNRTVDNIGALLEKPYDDARTK